MTRHGNDPTHTGTDHTREKVPFLAYSPVMRDNGKLEEAQTFCFTYDAGIHADAVLYSIPSSNIRRISSHVASGS